MKLLTLILFAIIFASNVTTKTCKVGDYNKKKSSGSNIGGYWYLNVEVPATCSGSIDQYKIGYYDDNLRSGTYYATLAVWKPTGGGSYEKDNNTIISYSLLLNDRRSKTKKKGPNLKTETVNLLSPVGVRRGSVIGIYLGTSNPIQVIGETADIKIKKVPTGVCRTADSVSAIAIDCSTGSNIQNQILHAEAVITVVECGNVPSVTNAIATLVDGDKQYGAIVQYNCSIGYIPTGNSTITCPLNGSWPTSLTCTIVECYEPHTSQKCKVGKSYKSKSRSSVSNIGGYWYLNVEVPATCSGSIDQYKLRYYYDRLNDAEYFNATLAIWKPTGGGSYEKDNNSILPYSFNNRRTKTKYKTKTRSRDRRRKGYIHSDRPDLISPVGVRKGSVIGVYLGISNPIQAIVETSDITTRNVSTGVCRTADNVSAITIDCSNGSNVQVLILNAEAVITVVDCGNVPNVTNAIATLVDGDTQYGATVQYNCSIGYIPIGNSTITCPLNGTWPTTLTCILVECSDPGAPVNGHAMSNNFTFGSTVIFSCDPGYKLQGNETAQCQANGQWSSNIPLCLIINCPDPGISNNDQRNSSNFSYVGSISFTCNTGNELSENILLTTIFTSVMINTTTAENIFLDTRLTFVVSSALIISIASMVIITLVLTVIIVCDKKSKEYKLRHKEKTAMTTSPYYETVNSPITLNGASEPIDENTLTEEYADYDMPVVNTTDIPMTECPAYVATTHSGNKHINQFP